MDYFFASVSGQVKDTPRLMSTKSGKKRMVFTLVSESPKSDNEHVECEVILYDEAAELDIRARYRVSIHNAKLLTRDSRITLKVRGDDAVTVRVLAEFDGGTVSVDEII